MTIYSVTEGMVAWLASLGYDALVRPHYDVDGTLMTEPPFVTAERTGGYVESYVDHATVAVQTWAETEDDAESMANAIRYALVTAQPPDGIRSVRVNSGPYAFFDETTRCPRYQLALDVTAQLTT